MILLNIFSSFCFLVAWRGLAYEDEGKKLEGISIFYGLVLVIERNGNKHDEV